MRKGHYWRESVLFQKSTKLYFHLRMAIFLLFEKSRNNVLNQIVSLLLWYFSRQQNIRYYLGWQLYRKVCYKMRSQKGFDDLFCLAQICIIFLSRNVFCIYLAIFLFKIRIIRFFVLRRFLGIKTTFSISEYKKCSDI